MKKKHPRYNAILNPPPSNHYESPFLRNLETTEERRVYSFMPTIGDEFLIVVPFPIEDYNEPMIEISGESLPETLINAIHFVIHNERQFSDVFDSRVKRPNIELSETALQEFSQPTKTESAKTE